jgi:hypothetical protein
MHLQGENVEEDSEDEEVMYTGMDLRICDVLDVIEQFFVVVDCPLEVGHVKIVVEHSCDDGNAFAFKMCIDMFEVLMQFVVFLRQVENYSLQRLLGNVPLQIILW